MDSPILASMRGLLNEQYRRVRKLEEENKKLKENSLLGQATMEEAYNRIIELEEENKKLKEERERWKEYQQRSQSADGEQIERLLGEKIKLEEENKNLKEEIRFLEECLDRKEKLNEKYRKELKNYVYDAKQVRDIC